MLVTLCEIDTKVRRWSEADIAVMKDMAAIVMREIALYREIAQRKHAEAQQQVLIAELHHRVKNTLAVVQGLVELSIRHTESLDAFRKSISGRIASLAKSHTLLVEGQWLSVGLRTMIEGELEAHEGGDRISISGDDVALPSRIGVAVGMAMHELITNAVEHDALWAPEGHVNVSWTWCRNRPAISSCSTGSSAAARPSCRPPSPASAACCSTAYSAPNSTARSARCSIPPD